jgi:4-carboxymuconolactone decarboxylase
LDYTDWLRLLALNDAQFAQACAGRSGLESQVLDSKTVALIRLAALIAEGGAVPSYSEFADAALDAGATPAEIVDVLVCAVPVVGLPRVVAEAPKLALALGYDTEEALEAQTGP